MDNLPDTMQQADTTALLTVYHNEVRKELDSILFYWMQYAPDATHGGFIGQVNENNSPNTDAPKGSVLNSRILWAFSAAYKLTKNAVHLNLAATAFTYISDHFIDKKYGGVYWSVTATGEPLDTKKQIYAQAFAMYGCCAYYEASHNEEAKKIAILLYEAIEKYSFDEIHTGYLEAFTKEWEDIADLRLSDKDANEKKTMNTHMHVMEAYTALYIIWPDEALKGKLLTLINNFTEHILDRETGHLKLFFNEEWVTRPTSISYGHDIEAAWLLLEAAVVADDEILIEKIKTITANIAIAASEGLDKDGGLWYEYEPATNHFLKEKHWWVQAEAMVGFFNHWQVTNDIAYLHKSIQSWQYIKAFIKDKSYGEWLWGRNEDGTIMKGQDKAGMWKCPYHNTRACIEIITRIAHLI